MLAVLIGALIPTGALTLLLLKVLANRFSNQSLMIVIASASSGVICVAFGTFGFDDFGLSLSIYGTAQAIVLVITLLRMRGREQAR